MIGTTIQGCAMVYEEIVHFSLLFKRLNAMRESWIILKNALVLVMTREAAHTLVFLQVHWQTSV